MSYVAFPVNNLLRKKLQTTMVAATLALSVASTLFLLLFSRKIGAGINSSGQILTSGLLSIFSQFVLFTGILIFAVGAVVVSFVIFFMMKQRTKDFGLIKASGCPNSLVFGYFATELLLVALASCVLGVVLGLIADFAVTTIFSLQTFQQSLEYWLVLLIFAVFFVLTLVFGAKPLYDAAKSSPTKAFSSVQYFGLTAGNEFKPLSKFGLTWKIASRSLSRRQSANIRVFLLLSIVFLLLTVSISGGVIANDTTCSWIKNSIGSNVVTIAHRSVESRYKTLLTKFSATIEIGSFNYHDEKLAVSETLIQYLKTMTSIENVDARLIVEAPVQEVSNFTIDPQTLATLPLGDSRKGDSLIVGINPQNTVFNLFLKGRFLNSGEKNEAVIGDSIAQSMFSPDPKLGILVSDPLLQSIRVQNWTFNIVGVGVDPLNNGKVTFVNIEKLQNLTGMAYKNIVLVKIEQFADRSAVLNQIRDEVSRVDSDLSVLEVDNILQYNIDFLSSIWSTVMLLPMFSLTSAALCLLGYTLLSAQEQHQELAILRTLGVKPKIVVAILMTQNLVVLFSSLAVGISLGVIATLMILIPEPVVTLFAIIEITGWLLLAFIGMSLLSLYSAMKFSSKPILKMMS